jgi:FlaA1/EpsC-like NDP-sugar epimerase
VTRKQNFFGRVIAAADLVVLLGGFLAAYWIRRKLWLLGYPILPIGTARRSAWIVTVIFPAWLVALRQFNLYDPVTYRRAMSTVAATIKAQILGSVLMLNVCFILRGFSGVSRPLLALIIMCTSVGLVAEKLTILLMMGNRRRLQRRATAWRVLLVGSRDDAESYLELLREHPEWNMEVVDVVSPLRTGTVIRGGNGNLHPTTEQ